MREDCVMLGQVSFYLLIGVFVATSMWKERENRRLKRIISRNAEESIRLKAHDRKLVERSVWLTYRWIAPRRYIEVKKMILHELGLH